MNGLGRAAPFFMTGYYGIPGGAERDCTKVHIVIPSGPVCRVRLGPMQEFQLCANGIVEEYVECRRCIRWNNARKLRRAKQGGS